MSEEVQTCKLDEATMKELVERITVDIKKFILDFEEKKALIRLGKKVR